LAKNQKTPEPPSIGPTYKLQCILYIRKIVATYVFLYMQMALNFEISATANISRVNYARKT